MSKSFGSLLPLQLECNLEFETSFFKKFLNEKIHKNICAILYIQTHTHIYTHKQDADI